MADDPTVAAPSLEPKYVFGLTAGVTGNCLYLNDRVIVYPASGVIVVRDVPSGRQKFIRLTTACRKTVTAMDLNAINHALAVATVNDGTAAEDDDESSYGETPIVSVYDLKSADLKYVFAEPAAAVDDGPRRFASVRFLYDNVYVAALAVGPGGLGGVVYYVSWRNSTVGTRVTVDGHVADVALNPIDTTICCFVGNELFRLMTKTEKEWSQYGFREANGVDFTCVCWLCGDRCLAGTSDGRVVLFKNGVLQAAYRPDAVDHFDVTVKSDSERLNTAADSTEGGQPGQPVRSCLPTQWGLVILVGGSTIYYFRKTDEGRKYVKDGVYVKSEDRYLQSPVAEGEPPAHFVESVCVSPDGETLTCVTKRAQLYCAPLSRLDENDDEPFNSPIEIKPLGEELHYGGVQSLSTSFWKPVLMTCGKIDFTIKVWNYLDGTLLLSKHYPKQVSSVSMHPTGLYSVVAFMDHVEFFMVHMDDLVTLKYFSVRDCCVTAFSEAGHMFALAKMDAIDVYCSVLFEKRLSCRSHMASIETLVWSNNDKNIVVYDAVGAICSFDTKTGKVHSHIAPYSGVAYTDLTVAEDADRMFVTAEDGTLREILERKVTREVNFHQGSLNAVSVSKSNSMLFLAAQNGVLLTVALPLMYQVVRKEYKMFNQSITKLCLAMDGSALISCSKDGSMCIWEVKDVVHNMQKSENRYSDDVLVNWSKLETIIGNTKKVEKEVTKLKTECTQTIDKLKAAKDQELRDTKNANSTNYEDAFVKIKELGEMQSDTERKLVAELTALKQIHDLRIASLDAKYGEKLAYKYEKNSKLEDKAFTTISESTKEFESLKEKLNKELHEAMADYEEKLKNKDEEMFKRKEKLVKEKDVLKMLAGDTEHDVDDKVMNTRNEFVFKLKKLKELHVKCMGELAEYKMKHNLYSRTTADLTNQAGILEADVEKLKQSAAAKQETISNLTRSLKMCNERIPIKEREIQDIQDEMRELNKELGVLTASIVGLEQATQPLILRIQEQKNLYEENEAELEKELKSLKRLDLSFDELKAEKESKDQEFGRLTKVVEGAYEEFNRILTNMRKTVQYNPRKRDDEKAIKKFFSKYVGENAVYKTSKDEIDARVEFNRQRRFLQRSIDGLKRTIKSLEVKNESHRLIMEENSKLIEEINGFRNDANTYLTKYNNLKYLLTPKTNFENGSLLQSN